MLYNLILKRYFAIGLSLVMLSGTLFFGLTQQAQAADRKGPGRSQAKSGGSREAMQSVNRAPAQSINRGPSQSFNRAPASRQGTTTAFTRGSSSQQRNFVDSRYRHNRSYPAHGQSFRTLPRDHRMIMHGHSRYYTYNGVWYRPYSGRYIVAAPPFGLFVPFLPLFYTTIWMQGTPYYYANDTYYTQSEGGYVIAEPPQENVSENPPPTDDSMENRLFIYPRKGQSEEKQANDRYECHKWSVSQTNYDPTNIAGIPADQITQKRMDYQRAMTACLDARGYTAK